MEITAMQELIEYIESNEIVYNKDLILKLKELLEKEKEQIIETYKDCQDNVLRMIMEKTKFPQAEEYYNQKYNDATK
jgi:hypothetical protein